MSDLMPVEDDLASTHKETRHKALCCCCAPQALPGVVKALVSLSRSKLREPFQQPLLFKILLLLTAMQSLSCMAGEHIVSSCAVAEYWLYPKVSLV